MSRRSRSSLASGAIFLCSGVLMCVPAWGQQPLDLTHSWVRSFPGTTGARSFANGVAVLDSDTLAHRGTVVVAGHATSEITMIMSPAAEQLRGFVAFLSPEQNPPDNWIRNFVDAPGGGTGSAVCTGASVASRLTIPGRHGFVSGWFSGDVDFGSGITHTTSTGRDAFLVKLDRETPSTVWLTTYGGNGNQEALAVGVGPYRWGGQVSPVGDPVRQYATPFDYE